MCSCLSVAKFCRHVARALPVVGGLLLLSGCGTDGYPEALSYPARTDPIVIEHAQRDAVAFDKPGEYPGVLFPDLPEEDKAKLLKDPLQVKSEDREKIEKLVVECFGTPAHPRVAGIGGADEGVKKLRGALNLDDETLARASHLYRQNCLHCHGLTGDGRGPTAPWVNPHPRDYRQGVFKFTSSKQSEGERKPLKSDIVRTIREGIEGTSMPSFRLLPDDDQEALASYVIHLSLRGEVEMSVLRSILKGELDSSASDPIRQNFEDYLTTLSKWWLDAENNQIRPDMIPGSMAPEQFTASVRHGFELFSQPGPASCISCHTDFGRQSALKYDYWGTVVRPADLTTGIYRGGRRPIDLFWRIHSGINGTGMTAFGGTVSSKDIWDIVNFLMVLPYPKMREQCGITLESK